MKKTVVESGEKLGKSKQIALSGIVCALCIALMFSTGLMPILTYAVPAVAGYILFILTFEAGFHMSIVAYFAVSLLALLTTPDKMAALVFILFFGYYGAIKTKIDNLNNKLLRFLIKFIVFNLALSLAIFISVKITGLEEVISGLEFLGNFILPGAFIVGNIFFICYEISLDRLRTVYLHVIRPTYFKTKK